MDRLGAMPMVTNGMKNHKKRGDNPSFFIDSELRMFRFR